MPYRWTVTLPAAKQLGVIGTGLIGGSVAAAARRAGWRVAGYDADPARLRQAQELGVIDEAGTSAARVAAGCNLLVLAVPLSAAGATLREVGAAPLVTDAISTKRTVQNLAAATLANPRRFVGAHPMAGSDRSGPVAARADLFDGATCFVIDAHSTERAALDAVKAFWASLGCRVVPTDADAHDALVAAMSHLPQVLASALAATLTGEEFALAGNGLRDTTRLAASDPRLWRDIILDNRAALCVALDRFSVTLASFRAALESNDPAALERLLGDARDRRTSLP